MKNAKQGLVIVNLGSPATPAVSDVRKYLNEFLTDGKVIDIPWLPRQLLVRGLITPFRAPKSAAAYRTVWTEAGSPLMVFTNQFAAALRKELIMPVSICMRYGNPTPKQAIDDLLKQMPDMEEVLIAPMYPHYAMSSYETALEYTIEKIKEAGHSKLKFKVLKPFYNDPAYIAALADSIAPALTEEFDTILFSYHGLPIRHLKKSDPTKSHCYVANDCCSVKSAAWPTCYKHQATVTTNLVKQKLGLEDSKVKMSFQSRLGSDPWIQPFTDKMFEELPAQGSKRILVICPAFVTDCLETLEEIHDRGKESFMHSGGENFVSVPCLNSNAAWVSTFASYCKNNSGEYAKLWH